MAEKQRIEERSRAILKARLRGDCFDGEACLLDISSRGLMASADPPPLRGAYIELIVGRHSLVGQVQWSEAKRFGVRLRERIDVMAVLGNEAGPTILKQAQAARGRPSLATQLAFSRHVARGFVMGMLLAVSAAGALTIMQVVRQRLSSLNTVETTLAGTAIR